VKRPLDVRATLPPLSFRSANAFAALAILAITAGCGGDASGLNAHSLTVTVSASPSPAAPGQAIVVTVRADPNGSTPVRWITLSTSGLVTMRDSVAVNGPGPQELSRTIVLPLRPVSGQLMINGSASVGLKTVSDQETVNVLDAVAPTILIFHAEPLPAQPGDSTHFNYEVTDAVGVTQVRVRVQGAFSAERSVTLPPSTPRATGIIKLFVPNDVVLGSTATATLAASDESGHVREASVTYSIPRDTRPPTAQLEFGGLRDDLTIGTGETAQIIARVTDNHQLAYVGYEGEGRRDSVAVTGSAATRAFPVLVKPEWRQSRPGFAVWARDVSGNLSEKSGGILPVFDWTAHPKVIVPFPNEQTPVDMVWDSKRSVVYLLRADFDRRINSRIDVIQVPSGTVAGSIVVGADAVGLSLTASGDSIVTTLPDLPALGVIDLTQQQRTLAIIPLQYNVGHDMRPRRARISGTHVFVPLVHGLYAGRLLDVDLANGSQNVRTDIYGTGELTQYPILLDLADGRLLLHRGSEGYSKNDTFLYNGASNTFAPVTPLPPVGDYPHFTSSPSGRMVFGNKLFSGNFTQLDSLAAPDWVGEFAKALSIDGETAYLATWYGYEKVRVSDGFMLEQVNLGTQPWQLLMLPTGNTLIALGGLPGTNKGEYSLILIDIR
jgi:hypothetical protein